MTSVKHKMGKNISWNINYIL